MKNALAAVLVVASLARCAPARAQLAVEAAADRERDGFVARRDALMWTLAGWAATSVGVGAVMMAEGDRGVRAAGLQNVAWGGIDGALAAFALVAGRNDGRRVAPESTWRRERATLARIFTVNAALDVIYVAVGGALLAFAKTEALRGTGAGVLAQGGFLLAFDTTGALVIGPTQHAW